MVLRRGDDCEVGGVEVGVNGPRRVLGETATILCSPPLSPTVITGLWLVVSGPTFCSRPTGPRLPGWYTVQGPGWVTR